MTETLPRVLVAGIGNIFFGDDAFGVAVVQRLAGRQLPEGVRVIDFGIRGCDLTFALLDDYEAVILVDAIPRGGPPGTLYVIEPTIDAAEQGDDQGAMIELHNLDPAKVLRLARALGGMVERVLLVGCEPAQSRSEDEFTMEMSEPVKTAVEQAIPLIESLAHQLIENARPKPKPAVTRS